MSYVCERPMQLSGHEYMPGQIIEDGHILPVRVKALKASGRIAELAATLEETKEGTVEIAVPIVGPDGEKMTVMLSADEVVEAIRILQMKAEDAAKACAGIEKEDVLILVHSAEGRQSVKKAARAQAEKLEALQEGSPAAEG